MCQFIQDVVILGGGTAGWMTACYLSKAFGHRIRITLIEAATIPKIGVGEATIPNLQRVFFDFLGIAEEEWMRHCNAAFKMGIKFVNWRKPDAQHSDEHFYHLFGLIPNCDSVPLAQYWALRRLEENDSEPLSYACYREAPSMDAKRSPRMFSGERSTHYAWHFDAHLVAQYLHSLATEWGVSHVIDELKNVELAEDGSIVALTMVSGRRFGGQLFVDCSGFRGLLINKALGEPFLDMSDHLLCDSAVATAVPHDDERYGIEPYTSAIAMNHGWTWKIPMLGRFGTGYVYSSKFASQDEATREFLDLWNLDEKQVSLNQIRFRTGRNRNAWVKNCVSIGLSSCFLEPLESTGIYFIYAAIYQLAKYFPDGRFDDTLRAQFNESIAAMYDDCRDFIQLHYFPTMRRDTPFWRANQQDLKLSDSIRNKLEAYKAGLVLGPPLSDVAAYYSDFETEFRNFWTNSSYYCILSGTGCYPTGVLPKLRYGRSGDEKAREMFAVLKRQAEELKNTLPDNYLYLKVLHGREKFIPAAQSLGYSPNPRVGAAAHK